MPAFVFLLLQGFAVVLSSVIGQWILGLGIGFVAFEGMTDLTTGLGVRLSNLLGQVPADLYGLVLMFKVHSAMSLILSAVSAKFAMQAAGSAGGVIKRLVIR